MTTDANRKLVMSWLTRHNRTTDVVRPEIWDILQPFASIFSLVGFVGIITNIVLLVMLVRKRLYRRDVFQLVGNLALVEVVRCLLVLPLLLTTVIIRDWRLGSFLCFVCPVLLPCTIHASVFTLLTVFIFRYLKVVHNAKCPVPAWTCIVTSWLLSIAILTPHAAFKRYIDLQPVLGSDFDGVGICVLRPGAEEKNREYVLSIFVVFYISVFIAVLILGILVQSRIRSREREFPPESTSFSMEMNIRPNEKENIDDEEDNLKYPNDAMLNGETAPIDSKPDPLPQAEPPVPSKKSKLEEDRKLQQFLVLATVLFMVLWLPFYLFYQAESLTGSQETRSYIAYLGLLLIGCLSSWSLPMSFSLWQMSRKTKYKIRTYFNPGAWGHNTPT